jgi:hypothetical protein
MTLRLPVAGPDLTPEERRTLLSRRVRIAIMPVGDILDPYEENWKRWHRQGFSQAMLFQQLIKLSLNGAGTRHEIAQACQDSCMRQMGGNLLRGDLHRFAQLLFDRIAKMWQVPPYNATDLVIYDANFQSFCGDSIYIEVMYREPTSRL